MSSVDRSVGAAVAVLGLAVLWTARAFPAVPGQKLGAGFLPMLIGAGLLLCGVGLFWRGWAERRRPGGAAPEAHTVGGLWRAFVIVGVVLAYILWAEALGFLLLAPLCLLAVFLALGVRAAPALLYAIAGTAVVHLAFYKLLRVPLPWGLLRPFY